MNERVIDNKNNPDLYDHASTKAYDNLLDTDAPGLQDRRFEEKLAKVTTGSLLKNGLFSVIAVAGAIALGAAAAVATSTGLMLATVAGAVVLGGYGLLQSFGVGGVTSAMIMAPRHRKENPKRDHNHSIQVAEQVMNEVGSPESSKVAELLAERSRQATLANPPHSR